MENASKALIMAGSVLIGVLILSLLTYLFLSYGDFSSEIYSQIEDAQIAKFNAQFLKYFNDRSDGSEDGPILCTAHDIMSVANLANQNNIEYYGENYDIHSSELAGIQDNGGAYMYVRIELQERTPHIRTNNNVETWSEATRLDFVKDNALHEVQKVDSDGNPMFDSLTGQPEMENQIKYYVCDTCEISETTKRVYLMVFKEVR